MYTSDTCVPFLQFLYMNKREIGYEHETMACDFLEHSGLKILCRNFRVRSGEIDIIALDGDILVFAEVKYRSSLDYGGASYAISRQKQNKIIQVAQWFMAKNKIPQDTYCRFDAVLIDKEEIIHIKNAWQ